MSEISQSKTPRLRGFRSSRRDGAAYGRHAGRTAHRLGWSAV